MSSQSPARQAATSSRPSGRAPTPPGNPRAPGAERPRRGRTALLQTYRLDLFTLAWIAYALLVRRFWFVTDDAFISFRYAQNLIRGYGLRFNPGEHLPVEGYSNFLWVLLCAVFEALRLEITRWPLLVSFACGTLLLWLVFNTLRRTLGVHTLIAAAATLSLGCFPPFALWSTSGMATVPFALLVFLTFERLALRTSGPDGIGGAIAGLLLALIRVEGAAWALGIMILAFLSRRLAGQRGLRPFLVFLLIAGLGYGVYSVWRCSYFKMFLPNTAYAKGELDGPRLMRGVNYVVSHELAFLTPILILPGTLVALRRRRLAVGLPTAALAWAFPVYAVLVTGDFMTMGRFLVPGFAFGAILLAWVLDDLWDAGWIRRGLVLAGALAVTAIGLLPGWNRHLLPEEIRERFSFRFNKPTFDSEYERWRLQAQNTADWTRRGKALRSYVAQRRLPDRHPSYVTGVIGATAYYSDLFLYDLHGLVTPEVAHRTLGPDTELRSPGHDKRVSRDYFLDHKPTILMADVVQSADPRAIVVACTRQVLLLRRASGRLRLEDRYAVDVARVPVDEPADPPRYIITWTRVADDADPRQAWADFERRVSVLRGGDHLPLPP